MKYLGLCKYRFARWQNRLTMHFSECIPVIKRRISVFAFWHDFRLPLQYKWCLHSSVMLHSVNW